MPRIHVEEDALNELKKGIATSGDQYERSLAKLDSLIEEIVSGDIQGEAADTFKAKYDSKKEDFNKLRNALEEAKRVLGLRTEDFTNMMDEVNNTME
jgi:uncharacterized protein YukE